jgi:hypothetical protein
LRGGEQVAARQHGRDRLDLDRGGLRIALFFDGAQKLGAQAERGKYGSNALLLNRPAAGTRPPNRFRQILNDD